MSSHHPSKSKILLYWKYWNIIERKIKEEIDWLRSSIDVFQKEEKNAPLGCRECFLRRIAILIVSGEVKATEITRASPLKSFWIPKKVSGKKIYRGSNWHRETTEKIEKHFLSLGYEVAREPNLHHGRADLGVFKRDESDLYIEVGTTSFFKLWMNLEIMKNFTYLIVPNDDKLIEFRKD